MRLTEEQNSKRNEKKPNKRKAETCNVLQCLPKVDMQCCMYRRREALLPTFLHSFLTIVYSSLYCCPCVTTLTCHRCSRNQNNRARQKDPSQCLDKRQNIFYYYYYFCVCGCVRKFHSSRGKREKKEEKSYVGKWFAYFNIFWSFSSFPYIYLQDHILGCLAPAFPPYFIILKLQAIFHVDRTSSILEAKDWNTFFSIYLFLLLCSSRLHTVNKVE